MTAPLDPIAAAIAALDQAADAVRVARALLTGGPATGDILTATLGPRGEYVPAGLVPLNDAYRAKWPSGWTDAVADPGDAATAPTRVPLHLVGAVIDRRVLGRTDIAGELRDEIWSKTRDAYATYMLGAQQDEVTGLVRFMPLWLDGVEPQAGGTATVVLPHDRYATDAEIVRAIGRWYELTFGPLD